MKLYKPFFLTEQTMLIKLNEWVEKIRMQDSFIDNLRLVYEFEYKYSKIVSTHMLNEKRKDNILDEIERRMEPIIDSVVRDVTRVYDIWLKEHKKFENLRDKEGWFEDSYADVLHNKIAFKDLLRAEYTSYARKFSKGFKQEVFDYLMAVDDVEDLSHFAKDYIYPLWVGIWKHSTMRETIKRIKERRNDLEKLNREPSFMKKQGMLNLAIHTMHQTGSMTEHIADFLECEVDDLERLSNLPMSVIKKWDEDLIEMGIY